MNIQWYPGHMTKARRAMEEDIRLVDLVIEITDARVPLSGRNPDLMEIGKNKARIVVLNKSDLADEACTRKWMDYFRSQGILSVCMDARTGDGKRKILEAVEAATKEKTERDRRKGIMGRPVRAMVAGIPNSGKSTFINTMAGKASAKTGNKPGVTKGSQWIRLNTRLELLDTPGILWPKFEDPKVGERLAMIGSVSDEILNITELAWNLITALRTDYPLALLERYKGEAFPEEMTSPQVLDEIARRRGCLKKGNEPDTERAARVLLDDFRGGKLGRISLEKPPAAR